MTQATDSPLILVVEDDLGLAELVREEVTQRGWRCLHAATGREALALLGAHSPDLVILDYSLPDMTALQILERTSLPPFLVTTGAGDERVAVAMMKQGARDYLVKDASFLAALPGAVERVLRSVAMERQLAEVQAQLKSKVESLRKAQKLESLGRMAGGIAHDFNNLFQAIQGSLEIACMKGMGEPEARAAVERALRVLGKASALAHQMLDVSGKSFRRSAAVDLNLLVGECLAAAGEPLGAARIQFQEQPGLPPIDGDPEQLRQVLAGLVANAREALGASNDPILVALRLEAQRAPDAATGVWVHAPAGGGPMVCLSIQDAGLGMTKEVLDKAFDPFFSTHRPGRGLGLAAALGILKGHGAGVWIRTAPGRGTLIRLFFPLAEARVPDLDPPREPESPLHQRSLLLVDDDEDLQESLGEFLRDDLGYPVFQARDGLEAVEVYRREQGHIGLILMDATMPRMTGPDAFRIIRELDPEARAVLCSGFSEEAGARIAREFHFAEFLKKPFALRTLQETIVRLMGGPPPAENGS